MKILYFHQHFSTVQGATGTRSFEMAKALIAEGHSVTIVCGNFEQGNSGLKQAFKFGRRRGTVDGIDVIELNLNYSNKLQFWRRVYIFLRYSIITAYIALTERSDLIFATSTPLTASIPGILSKRLLGKKFVFEVRDLWPELPEAMGIIRNRLLLKILKVLEMTAYKSADRIIALAPGIADGIVAAGIDRRVVETIPNGCDFKYFSGVKNKYRPVGVSKNNLMALFPGTHGKANGLDSLIEAATILNEIGRHEISIVLIGDGSEKKRLKKKVETLKIQNIFFLDPMPKTELTKILAAGDVGLQILSNIREFQYGTSPNKFFDYLASGLPVITNYPGWVADLINENNCGISVPPDNPKKLAEALIFLADNRKILPQFSKNAERLGKDNFDRTKLAKNFVTLLSKIGH